MKLLIPFLFILSLSLKVILLLSIQIHLSQEAICPEESSDWPCSCDENGTVSCLNSLNGSSEALAQVFSDWSAKIPSDDGLTIDQLILINNGLESLKENTFGKIKFVQIEIIENNLTTIDSSVFKVSVLFLKRFNILFFLFLPFSSCRMI